MILTDCGVVIEPSAAEARRNRSGGGGFVSRLVGRRTRVAMLSVQLKAAPNIVWSTKLSKLPDGEGARA